MKLIDIDVIRAEIERLKDFYDRFDDNIQSVAKYNVLVDIISFLDALEVQKVDLEKEVNTWRHNHFHGRRDNDYCGEYLERSSQLDIAKHFFNLGISSQLSWQDVKRLIEIGDALLNDTGAGKLSEQEYYSEILNKFKTE